MNKLASKRRCMWVGLGWVRMVRIKVYFVAREPCPPWDERLVLATDPRGDYRCSCTTQTSGTLDRLPYIHRRAKRKYHAWPYQTATPVDLRVRACLIVRVFGGQDRHQTKRKVPKKNKRMMNAAPFFVPKQHSTRTTSHGAKNTD